MAKLKDRIAVITGGSSGIGLAVAQRFEEEGAYVFITGRRQAELDKAVGLIGKQVEAVQGDATQAAGLARLYERVMSSKGKLDIFVADSGIAERSRWTISPKSISIRHLVNARATLFTVQKAPSLMSSGGVC